MADVVCPAYAIPGLLYGVEFEIEAEDLYVQTDHYDEESEEYVPYDPPCLPWGWRVEPEDSIIGVECVFDGPMTYEAGSDAIRRLFVDIRDVHCVNPVRTPRGSTHVHVNMSDATWAQMESFVYAAAWAEPFLIDIAGKGRRGNLFALSYSQAPVGWNSILDCIHNRKLRFHMDTHYMAINFKSLDKWGTVEFRMGPSMRNANEALEWFDNIHAVASEGKAGNVSPHEPPAFIERFRMMVPPERFSRIYDKAAKQVLDIHEKLCYIVKARWEKQKSYRKKIEDEEFLISQLIDSNALTNEILSTNNDWFSPPISSISATHEEFMNVAYTNIFDDPQLTATGE